MALIVPNQNTGLSGYNLFKKVEQPRNPLSGSLRGALGDVSQNNVPDGSVPGAVMTEEELGLSEPKPVNAPNTAFQGYKVPANQGQIFDGSKQLVSRPQITSTEDLAAAMGYTSPEEEARLRKASVSNQRLLAVADALRHIGNIAHTVNYAPSQQFNQPWREAKSEYERGMALRNAANSRYLSYQQQKAAQDAKMRQLERDFQYKQAKDAADYQLKKNESEARQQRQAALAELDKARLEGQLDKNTYQRLVNKYYPETAQTKIQEIESRIAKNNRTGGGKSGGDGSRRRNGTGAKYEFYDKDGNLHTSNTALGIEAKLQEYAPEISSTEEYTKGVDAFGKDVKGTRKVSVGNRVGNANKAYRPKKGVSKGTKVKINW